MTFYYISQGSVPGPKFLTISQESRHKMRQHLHELLPTPASSSPQIPLACWDELTASDRPAGPTDPDLGVAATGLPGMLWTKASCDTDLRSAMALLWVHSATRPAVGQERWQGSPGMHQGRKHLPPFCGGVLSPAFCSDF